MASPEKMTYKNTFDNSTPEKNKSAHIKERRQQHTFREGQAHENNGLGDLPSADSVCDRFLEVERLE